MAGFGNLSNLTLYSSFQAALTRPCLEKCSQLTQLIQDAPLKELQYVYSSLVEAIFGIHSNIDWGLLTLDKEHHYKEFEAIKKFLSPEGVLLKIAYKLIDDFSPKFDFPIACLPVPTRLMLQEGNITPLYSNKLHIINPGVFPNFLQLNAFEYYFFHFSYYIVNPSFKNLLSTVHQQDTLYAHCLESYLAAFLPTTNSAISLCQNASTQHSSIASSLSSSYTINNLVCPDFLSPIRHKPSLLKKGTILMVASSPGSNTCNLSASPLESWKAETFLLILKEFYLNQNLLEQQTVLDLIPKIFVPSHYHVWMVRLLVKHLHFFTNSILSSNHSFGHGQIMLDSLARLKSLGTTQLIQKELYNFLKSSFDHWPLDASFRMPLETWLSYIQPWRYSHCEIENAIWQKFVTQNIHFYTTLYQQVLKRFLRMDLSCPKNAYMVFRATKVFAIPDLRGMIIEAEEGLSSSTSKSLNIGLNPPYLSSEKSEMSKFLLRHLSEFELSNYNYVPLFSEQVFQMVTLLLASIANALSKVSSQVGINSINNNSLFSKIYNYFEKPDDLYNSDDNNPSDMKKVTSYLEASSQQLCEFFKEVHFLKLSSITCNSDTISASSINKHDEIKFNDFTSDDKLHFLNKKNQSPVKFHGNPDLQPVRTYEIGFLVKIFNQVSQNLNEKFNIKILHLYNQPTIMGKICRQVISKPVTFYDIKKSSNMKSISYTTIDLPPRINLRFLANKKLIYYILIVFLLSYSFFSPIFIGLILFLIFVLCVILSSMLFPFNLNVKED